MPGRIKLKTTRGKSQLEQRFLRAWERSGSGEEFVRELRFFPGRQYRFDFALTYLKFAVEIEGGTFVHGRHNTGIGLSDDCDKYNQATLRGWAVIRLTTKQLGKDRIAETIDLVKEVIRRCRVHGPRQKGLELKNEVKEF